LPRFCGNLEDRADCPGGVGIQGRGSGVNGGTWRIRQIARGPSEHDSTQTMLPRPRSVARSACPSRASEKKEERGAEAKRASGVQPGCPAAVPTPVCTCSMPFPLPHPLQSPPPCACECVNFECASPFSGTRDAVPAVLPAAHRAPAQNHVANALVACTINAT